jgi:hypothetical protein
MKIYFLIGNWTKPEMIIVGSAILIFYISIKYKEWFGKIKDWFK